MMAKRMSQAEYRKRVNAQVNAGFDKKTLQEMAEFYHVRDSHHEAAHAAFHWLFGWGEEIDFISMDVERAALVSRTGPLSMICRQRELTAGQVGPIRHWRRALIYTKLAGPAATAKHEGEAEWLEDAIEAVDGLGCQRESEFNDIDWAYEFCLAETRDRERKAHALLEKSAGLVDELLALPQVWGLVTAVAGVLRVGKRTPGSKVVDVLEKAWEPHTRPGHCMFPVADLGQAWLDRLGTDPRVKG